MTIAGVELLALLCRAFNRADQAVEQGLTDLRESVRVAPEWKLQGNGPSGHSHYVAERQVLAGMLAYLEAQR